MPLNEREQRILEEIERQFYQEDPKLAQTVAKTTLESVTRRWQRLAVVGFVGGGVASVVGRAVDAVQGALSGKWFSAIGSALGGGFAKAGKSRQDFEISYPVFVVTGKTEEELAEATVNTRRQIAFYGSTPAYKPVLDSIGVGELQGELNAKIGRAHV